MNFSSNAWHALADIIWHVACKAGSARRRRFFAAMAWTKGPVIALAVALPLADDAHAAGTLDKPLTGQPQAISPQNAINRTPGTLVRVIRDNQVLRTLTTAIPLRLPRRNLVAIDGRSRLTLSDAQSFVIDPEAGDWYALTDQGDGSTLTIEGDNRLLASVGGCANRKDRNIFIGPTYTKPGEVTDTEYGPKKEILAIFDCVPYRALLECDDISDKCDAAKAALNNSALTSLAAPARLDIPERLAPRALLAPSNGPILPPEPRPAGSINEFRYHAPGRTLIRQYLLPVSCKDTAKGAEFIVDKRTPYSRLIFAGPNLMSRFPVALPQDKRAVANSQIFGPGGGFLVTRDGVGHDVCGGSPKTDGTMGSFGDEEAYDERNFTMPWADTFCEWRGNIYTQPFCAADDQQAVKGPHYGVDVRAWTIDANTKIPILSVSNGVVVEVDEKAKPEGGRYVGFVVKIRSQHLIFVYRHMNADLSPFDPGADNRLYRGDRVRAGQLIGYMGRFLGTPAGTTLHVHFEIEAPVPRSVLLGPACLFQVKGGKRVRVCTAREKAPPYASLITAYFADRYGFSVPMDQIDASTGLTVLPVLNDHEISSANAAPPHH